jgi:hypothetical protein
MVAMDILYRLRGFRGEEFLEEQKYTTLSEQFYGEQKYTTLSEQFYGEQKYTTLSEQFLCSLFHLIFKGWCKMYMSIFPGMIYKN